MSTARKILRTKTVSVNDKTSPPKPVRIDIWDFSDQSHKAATLFGMFYWRGKRLSTILSKNVQDQFQHFRGWGWGNVPCWTVRWMLVAIQLLYCEMDVGGDKPTAIIGWSFLWVYQWLSPSSLHILQSKMCRRHFLTLVLLWPSRPWCFAITVPFSVSISFFCGVDVDLAAATS